MTDAAEQADGLPKAAAVVVGAGRGRRMGGLDKAFLPVLGRPLLCYAVEVFESCPQISQIALVVAEELGDQCRRLVDRFGWRKVTAIRPGGAVRAASVRAGLAAVSGAEWVLVHDAARPLVTPAMVTAGLATLAAGAVAAIAAVPVRDTLKMARANRTVARTVDRSRLWAAQTPQVFRRESLVAAFERAGSAADACTDEGALLERQGIAVQLFPGDPANIKVTLPDDVPVVEALLRYQARLRQPGGTHREQLHS